MSAPTQYDLDHPQTTITIDAGPLAGTQMAVLTPYWQGHPNVQSDPQPGAARLAHWHDGFLCAVPDNASPATLAAFYVSGRVALELLRQTALQGGTVQ